jgi:hypothetical protein
MAPLKAPRRRFFGAFVHVKARFFQNYRAMILRAARKKRGRAVDVDGQKSKEGTPHGAHWPTIGRNKYHDRLGVWGPGTRLDTLTDDQIKHRLRGPHGERLHSVAYLLKLAARHDVRVELEVKVTIDQDQYERLLNIPEIDEMNDRGDLQVKTLAKMGKTGREPINRLRPASLAGIDTILSFTEYRGPGISKALAWPVTDFVRGRAKWRA